MASGMEVCKITRSFSGTLTVSKPTPERKHALEAITAAPIRPTLPATKKA